jgi:hypothetical protein
MRIRPTAQIAALMSVAALGMIASATQYVESADARYGAGYSGKMKGRRGTSRPKKERNRKGASR